MRVRALGGMRNKKRERRVRGARSHEDVERKRGEGMQMEEERRKEGVWEKDWKVGVRSVR